MNYFGKKRDIILEMRSETPQIIKMSYESFIKANDFLDENSLRRIVLNQDFYEFLILDHYNSNNKPLLVLVSKTQDKELVLNSINMYFETFFSVTTNSLDYCQNNLWWNIKDDYIMFFNSPNKVLKTLSGLKSKYIARKFSPVFKNQSEKLIFNRSFVTSIKDYKCDFKNQIHYLEFFKGSRIDKILMEVLLISKTNLGRIIFNINEEDIIIDSTYSLNEILITIGLRLDQICFSTKTVKQLENEFIQKQESSKKLCYILKKISENI